MVKKAVRNIEKEKRLLVLLGSSGVLTKSAIRATLKWTQDSVRIYLDLLEDKGLVKKFGQTQRNTFFGLTKSGTELFECFVRTEQI